jgi:hypothetical protein
MILASHGILASSIASADPDWLAYYNRVIAAGGSLSTTEQNATKTLVADLKSAGIWSAMKAIYPMVGASAAACAQNLKSSSFTGTFTSGWTFASTGVTPNGTSAYMNTGLTPSTSLAQNSASMGVYSRTNIAANYSDYGVYSGIGFLQRTRRSTDTGGGYANFASGDSYTTNTSSLGLYCLSRISSSSYSFYKNGSATSFLVASTGLPTLNSWLGAGNLNGSILEPSTRELAFHYISDGLTDTNISNLTTAVQAFQTTLSRNV